MGWPNLLITEPARCRLSKISGILAIIEVLLFLIVFSAGVFVFVAIQKKIHLIEGYNAKSLPIYMLITGGVGILLNIVGSKTCLANGNPDKREKWSVFLLGYAIVSLVLFLCVLIGSIVCFGIVGQLENAFSTGIKSSMEVYSMDVGKKSEIDLLQIEESCCGSKAYTDWFHVSWILEDYIGPAKKDLLYKKKEKYLNDDVPYSCCDPNHERPCVHHHVHDNDEHYNYDFRSEVTLYRRGCTEALMNVYGKIIMDVGIINLVTSLIQLIIVILARFLQTSIFKAQESGDAEMAAIGFLLPFGASPDDGKEVDGDKEPLLNQEGVQADGEQEGDTTADKPDEGDEYFDDSTFDEDDQAEPNDYSKDPTMTTVNIDNEEPIYENVAAFNDQDFGPFQGSLAGLPQAPAPPGGLTPAPPSVRSLRGYSNGSFGTLPPAPPSMSRIPQGSYTAMPPPFNGSASILPYNMAGDTPSEIYNTERPPLPSTSPPHF